MRKPPPRTAPARGWGAPPEPYDDHDDGRDDALGSSEDRDDGEPARRKAPAPRGSGSLSPVTLGYGFIVLAFGLWMVARRWKWVSNALDLRDASSGARDMAAQLGLPVESVADALPYDTLFLPMIAGGILGLIAAVMMVAIGALLLLKSGLAVRPGARGLLAAGGVFALAHLCDVWLGYRTITMQEDMVARMAARLGGDERVRAALAGGYARLAAVSAPSLSDYVVDALVWVVPTLLALVWGARHLESPEVKTALRAR